MIWAFRCSNMAPPSWKFAINLLPHAEISWGALISLVMLLVSQLYVRAYARKAAATEAGSSLGSLVWHTGTPEGIIRMQNLGDGWWWHRYVLCIFDALVQTWTSLDELEWSCHKVTSLGNSPKPPSCTLSKWWIFRIQPDIYIYLNYVESTNFCTRYHRGPLWRWNFLGPWHRHLRHKNCQAANAPEEVQWLDWWSLKNLRK